MSTKRRRYIKTSEKEATTINFKHSPNGLKKIMKSLIPGYLLCLRLYSLGVPATLKATQGLKMFWSCPLPPPPTSLHIKWTSMRRPSMLNRRSTSPSHCKSKDITGLRQRTVCISKMVETCLTLTNQLHSMST